MRGVVTMGKAAGQATSKALLAMIEKGNAADATRIEEVRQLAEQYQDANTYARNLIARKLLTKWQITQLHRGTWQLSLGKYRLLDERGIGRIGRELVAEHVNLGRKVVIKLVSRILTSNPKRLQQFLVDFRKVAAIDYPHLVHSFDVDQENNRYFVVTEYVDGDNLEVRIQREDPLTPEQAMQLLYQAAKGLAYAASQGMIHGDLKPSNLMVDKNNQLKVTDLGYVRLIDGSEVHSEKTKEAQEQAFHSGLEYRAPEQMNGTADWSDPRLDLYSFGQVLFYLLTGAKPEPPLPERSERRSLILEKVPDLPTPLADLYSRLTSPEVEERPKSWNEVIPVLANALKLSGVAVSDSKTIEPEEVAPVVATATKNGAGAPVSPAAAAPKQPTTAAKLPAAKPAVAPKPAAKPLVAAPLNAKKLATSEEPTFSNETEEAESLEEVVPTKAKTTPAGKPGLVKAEPLAIDTKPAAKAPEKKAEPAAKKPSKPLEKAAPLFAPPDSTEDEEEAAAEVVDEIAAEDNPVEEEAPAEEPAAGGFDFSSFAPVDRTKGKSVSKPTEAIKPADKKAAPLVDTKKEAPKKTAAKKEAAAPEAESAADGESAPTPKKAAGPLKLSPALLIGGAVAALVLMLLVGGVGLYFLLGSGKAKKDPAAEVAKQPTEEPKTEEKTDVEEEAPANPTTKEEEKKPAEEEVNPGEVNPSDLVKNPEETDPEKMVASVDPLNPDALKPEEPKVTEPASEEKKPDESTPETTPPAVEPPPEKQPEEKPKPPPMPPKPAPAVDVLKELPTFFKLPDVAGDKPAETIGKLELAGRPLIVELHGGATATKSKMEFDLKAADGGTSREKWEITLSKTGESPVLVAVMRIFENQLQFGWTSAGRSNPASPYLMNCMLRLSSGSSTKQILFRQPALIPPLKVDFDKPVPLKFVFENAPDAKNIRIEVLATPENGFPGVDYRPERTFEAGKPNNFAWIGDKDNQRFLGLKFESKPSAKGLDVAFTTVVKIDESKPDAFMPYTKKKFKDGGDFAELLVKQAVAAKTMNLEKLKAAKTEDKAANAMVEADIKAKEDVRNRFTLLSDLMSKMNQQATLHARVTYDFPLDNGIGKIVLAETEGAPAPPPPPAKKK
jgi:serine/threonine protein kinase